jgi:hypothetical protein
LRRFITVHLASSINEYIQIGASGFDGTSLIALDVVRRDSKTMTSSQPSKGYRTIARS